MSSQAVVFTMCLGTEVDPLRPVCDSVAVLKTKEIYKPDNFHRTRMDHGVVRPLPAHSSSWFLVKSSP